MKILAFSGAHENGMVAEIFLNRVERLDAPPDVFVSAGDLGPNCMTKILRVISRKGTPILFVQGNHILHYPQLLQDGILRKVKEMGQVFALDEGKVDVEDWTFIGQDARADFTDDERDPERYYDLKHGTEGLDANSTILVTHHAPLGVFDSGSSYPLHSYSDKAGELHAGSLALRFFVEEFRPRIHIFAHCHGDGSRHALIDGTLFANVCHLERRTKEGAYGETGSFEVIDTSLLRSTTYHLSVYSPRRCPGCGSLNFIRYRRCVNCSKGTRGLVRREDLP